MFLSRIIGCSRRFFPILWFVSLFFNVVLDHFVRISIVGKHIPDLGKSPSQTALFEPKRMTRVICEIRTPLLVDIACAESYGRIIHRCSHWLDIQFSVVGTQIRRYALPRRSGCPKKGSVPFVSDLSMVN